MPRLPTGFIPNLDRAILIISIQLPPGASLARTDAVVQQGDRDRCWPTPGVKYSNAFTRPQRRDLHGGDQRRPAVPGARRLRGAARAGLTIDKIAQDVRGKLAQIEEAQTLVFIPPPVRGMGAAAGFSMRLQDTLGMPAD